MRDIHDQVKQDPVKLISGNETLPVDAGDDPSAGSTGELHPGRNVIRPGLVLDRIAGIL